MKIRKILGKVKRALIFAIDYPADRRCQKLANYNIGGKYKRIYLYHVRKTGGTSLNNMFLSLGGEKRNTIYNKLITSISYRAISNNYVFQAWNPLLLERGNYFYGFSHIAFHDIYLPKDTFKIVCFRDPINRVLSHYRMLMEESRKDNPLDYFHHEKNWLGKSFHDFIELLPKNHLLNQLYMFSKTYNVIEAYNNIKKCDCIFFTETFNDGISEINIKLGLELEPIHIRATSSKSILSDIEKKRLYEILKPEYELIEKIKSNIN